MSVTEVLEAVRALSEEEWRQVRGLLDTVPGAPDPQVGGDAEQATSDPYTIPPAVTDPAERVRLLGELVEHMRANPLVGDPPRLTRDELHERR